MTSIEVPDWVVDAGDAAIDTFAEQNTMSMFESRDAYHKAMLRSIITAALGAWVVREAWAGADFPNWIRRESEQLRKLTREAQPEHGFTTPLYTLRQEKPE